MPGHPNTQYELGIINIYLKIKLGWYQFSTERYIFHYVLKL